MPDKNVIHEILLEGQKKFAKSKIKPSDKKAYGKMHGREDLLAFARFIDPEFQTPPHIEEIAKKLTLAAEGKIKRLIINVPPGHGKSHLCTEIFPTWYLGNHPTHDVMVASYASSLAAGFTRWQRNTIESDSYREIFPEVYPGDKWTEDDWELLQGGSGMGAGVDGGFTGRRANILIIDDVYKNFQEAMSDVKKETVWNWYRFVIRTRLAPNGVIIIVNTRAAKDDLSGKLLERGKWEHVVFQALNPDGSVLFPTLYSEKEINELREDLGEDIFQTVYQQNPQVNKKAKLLSEIRISDDVKIHSSTKRFAYLDPGGFGDGSNVDYNAVSVGCQIPLNPPLQKGVLEEGIHVMFGDIWESFDETYDRVEAICKEFNVSVLYMESNAAQGTFATEFRKRGIIVEKVHSSNNKHLRIVTHLKNNLRGVTFLHRCTPEYIKQITDYSLSSKHDDAPDSAAGLIRAILPESAGNLKERYSFIKRLWRRR
ncbi:MAG TPA: terminase family protein [Leptospiraceae bacterium]|nr:terminase family protein [Leptospiraceae bacterium]HMW08575.1 terminase family protein [Leptospiraceae bacterium]HMZ66482.1 terminase family protein [Leptospiraceae bacterium]HNA10024.1 terminase family protein [Leptospiraceae bacterium]HNC00257.1 terminase family protein [Leptospiraceae bacterium]